jgi:hypothetical protein
MLVYGDRRREVATAEALAREDFFAIAELAQGLIDAEFEAAGTDDLTPLHAAAVADLRRLASGVSGSSALAALPLPPRVAVKEPEGYAFYAVYPEAYAQAARRMDWSAPPFVIGLRSIGLGLAAHVAGASGAVAMISLRPVGPPFRRTLRLSDRLRAQIGAHAGPFAVVDEGPGLSGSSFGAVLDLLESLGVARERIVVFPSHAGDLGPEADPAHRRRWAALRRVVVDFAELSRHRPVGELFADRIGPALQVEDLSAGAWREGRPLPAFPQQERLKFRITTADGRWLARFAGLGDVGREKFERARVLHAAGAAPEPVALRWGFLLSRWEDGAAAPPTPDELARYLQLRASLPAPAGASPAELAEMIRVNAGELGLAIEVEPPGTAPRPVAIDGRLHAWEWIRTPAGRLLKTDALDHCRAHDLVGGQDIAWDVAGAAVEFGLHEEAVERLRAAVGADAGLLAFCRLAYPAFQAGLWSFAGDAAQVERYRSALETAAALAGSRSKEKPNARPA